jgi:hypothetical protein
MSKHVGRKKRWTQVDAKTHSSALGRVVYDRNAWHGLLDYRTLQPPDRAGGTPGWLAHSRRLGPFKRPRDAMVALEREATFLKNCHGEDVLFGEQLWAEGGNHVAGQV